MAGQQKNAQDQDLNQLRKVRREKLAELQERGEDPFLITKYDVTHHSQEIKDHFEELENKEVSVAGRIMQKRVMGKASFCNIQDLEGNIQSYVARDNIGEDHYKDFKKFDIGDIVGIRGTVFQDKDRRDLDSRRKCTAAFKESAGASGEIPRTDRYRYKIQTEICGSDHEPRGKRYIYQTF